MAWRVCADCNARLGSALDIGLARNSWEAVLRITRSDFGDPKDIKYDRVLVQLPAEHPMAPMLLRFTRRGDRPGPFCTPVPQIRITLSNGARKCIPEWNIEKDLPVAIRGEQPTDVAMFASLDDPDAFARIEAKSRLAGLTSIKWHTIEESAQASVQQIDASVELTIDVVVARAIAKIAYEYFVWSAANSFEHLIKPDIFAPIRELVLHGMKDWRGLVVPGNKPILADETETLRHANCHLIAIRWETEGVVARIALYNDIVYTVKVCPPPSTIVHRIDNGHYFDLSNMEVHRLASSSLLHPPLPWPGIIRKNTR